MFWPGHHKPVPLQSSGLFNLKLKKSEQAAETSIAEDGKIHDHELYDNKE